MSETLVYGCDWCDDIVEKNDKGEPMFFAVVTRKTLRPAGGIAKPEEWKICGTCNNAFSALTQGRYKR